MTAGNDALRILIVDDDHRVREAIERTLTDENFTVKSVESGSEAVMCLSTDCFDVILLDLWMPGLTGMDTLESVRRRDRNLSIIAMSGMGTDAATDACMRSGAFGFLQKPFKRAVLLEVLFAAGAASRNARELAAARGEGPGSILFADDHDKFRRNVAQRLRLDGFLVGEASNGDEALSAWRRRPFDIYLFDEQMPRQSGAEAAATILAAEPDAAVILLCAESARSEWIKTARVCVAKPLDYKKMMWTILFIMETARRGKAIIPGRRPNDELRLWARSVEHLQQKARKKKSDFNDCVIWKQTLSN